MTAPAPSPNHIVPHQDLRAGAWLANDNRCDAQLFRDISTQQVQHRLEDDQERACILDSRVRVQHAEASSYTTVLTNS